MNEKLKKFTELCLESRTKGLTEEKHLEKKKLADELVEEGLMINKNNQYEFINAEDMDYFLNKQK